jgi:hypothetical protein
MPITKDERELRRKAVGSSDVPAILGYDSYRTVGDVYKSKRFVLEETDKPWLETGNAFESAIIDYASRIRGVNVLRNIRREVPGTPIVCNIDGVEEDSCRPWEAKTCGVWSEYVEERNQWGEPGTDIVPDRVLVQANTHLAALPQADLCIVPVLLVGRGILIYEVPRNDDLIDTITETSKRFWQDYVLQQRMPGAEWGDYVAPSLDVVKQIRRVPGSVITFNSQQAKLVDQWERAKAAVAFVTKAKELAEAAWVAQLGDAEAADLPDGNRITYLEQHRKEHLVKAYSFRQGRIIPREKVQNG